MVKRVHEGEFNDSAGQGTRSGQTAGLEVTTLSWYEVLISAGEMLPVKMQDCTKAEG